jgi:hypothetical protein
MVFSVWFVRPEEMVVRAAHTRIFPEPTMLFEIIDRSRIWTTVVETSDLLRDIE